MQPNETVEILINAEEISTRIQSLADEIIRDYGDTPIILMCALTGGVIFLTDLSRKLGNNATLDFVRASSYEGTETTGTVSLDCHPKLDLTGKEVLLVEDIVDTGKTLSYLKGYLQNKGAARVRVCAFLDKPSRRQVNINADYVGFVIPNEFVVGYGLDYDQRYRNLPYVGVLRINEE